MFRNWWDSGERNGPKILGDPKLNGGDNSRGCEHDSNGGRNLSFQTFHKLIRALESLSCYLGE